MAYKITISKQLLNMKLEVIFLSTLLIKIKQMNIEMKRGINP
jgi:hypothetical protein